MPGGKPEAGPWRRAPGPTKPGRSDGSSLQDSTTSARRRENAPDRRLQMSSTLTRRALGRLLGATAGAALIDARFPSPLRAAPPTGTKGLIRLSANENPYGPCAASLEALGRCGADASRYPGSIE